MTHVERLRTRIAAALVSSVSRGAVPVALIGRDYPTWDEWLVLADAVIAELGLEPQPHPGPDYALHRWVTNWVADE